MTSPLEPYEVQELRHANGISAEAFTTIVSRAYLRFPERAVTYPRFEEFVRGEMGHRIVSGHLLDRVFDRQLRVSESESLPLAFALTALQLTVRDSAEERARALLRIAAIEQRSSVDADGLGHESLVALVGDLQRTCQLSVEKQVAETGVRYPYKTHRPKTPADLVAKARGRLSPVPAGDRFSEAEALAMLLGPEICLWGECYRGNND